MSARSLGGKVGRILLLPAGLAGGFLGASLAAVQPGGTGIVGLLIGWLYGVSVRAGIRLFRVPAGAFPLVGLLAGPLPFALLMPRDAPEDERGLIWIGCAVGLVLGLVEWAHERFERGAGAGVAQGPSAAADPRT